MDDNKPKDHRPIHHYWWFWVFVALVIMALAKHLGFVKFDSSIESLEIADPSFLRVVCNIAFPCGLVWEIRSPTKAPPTPTPPASDQRY